MASVFRYSWTTKTPSMFTLQSWESESKALTAEVRENLSGRVSCESRFGSDAKKQAT